MTHDLDLDHVLGQWMDDGPTVVADRVIAAAMTTVHTTLQRGSRWAPLRERFMTGKPVTIGIGLTAAVVLAIAALEVFGGTADVSSPSVTTSDLAEIVVTNENAPEGWTVETTRRGLEALDHLIRYGEVRNATGGFVDARATDFCAEGQGCGTSWVALYRSDADADAAFSVLNDEMQVGWGLGPRQVIRFAEDEGYAYMNNLGNAAANHAYLWRKANVLLGVIGVAELEGDALRPFAEAMNARSR